MRSFTSARQMIDAHEAMFGAAGRKAAVVVLHWAPRLFAEPLDPLKVRVILAPVELGPYNKHGGYHADVGAGEAFILGNRHQCHFRDGDIVLDDLASFTDFIVHELTHARQAQLEKAHGWARKRGAHRDRGWFTAVSEAAPNYLGIGLPESVWPTGSRRRRGTLTEVEMTHWPHSIRKLVAARDARLSHPSAAA